MGRVMEGYKQLVKKANEIPEIKEMMTGWNKIIQFDVEGEGDFFIKFENGVASFHIGRNDNPDVTLKGSEEVFYKMLSGELDPTKAFFARKYKIEGSMGDAIKFGRIGSAVFKAMRK